MSEAPDIKSQALKALTDKVENMFMSGCSNYRLHEQRFFQMEKGIEEIKQAMERGFVAVTGQVNSLDEKVTEALKVIDERSIKRFEKINNIVIGILIFTILLAFFAGVNVWEIARNYMGVIKH